MRKLAAALLAAGLVVAVAAYKGVAEEPPGGPCAARGPTTQGAPISAVDLKAVPLASQGLVVVSVAWADRLTIIDLATGSQRAVESGIDEPHERVVAMADGPRPDAAAWGPAR